MSNEKLYEILMTPFSVTCKTGVQCCHICEREDCCDNDNPLVAKIKKLEKEIEEWKEGYQVSREEIVEEILRDLNESEDKNER